MIEVSHLSKRYTRHLAVDDISFRVDEGDVVGFLGPNGAGKSTTLKMLTGFLPPTSGAASIAGFDIFRESIETRRRIGYMPENVPLYPEMRVREYLKFRAALKGLKGSTLRKQVTQVIETCGLGDMRRRMIKTLSKGYRQRVGLADALVHEPELLILDEPTNGLDPNQILSIRQLIRQLGKSYTILLSTHILHEVEMACNKVIIIDQGKIKAADSPKNLVESMRRAGEVHVELRAPASDVQPVISAMEDVTKVSAEELPDGWTRYAVIVAPGTDARERIARLAQSHQWPLRSLRRLSATLEEVFVELTRKD